MDGIRAVVIINRIIHGVTEAFRIVGSACMDVLDPFPAAGPRHISTQNVAHMVLYEQDCSRLFLPEESTAKTWWSCALPTCSWRSSSSATKLRLSRATRSTLCGVMKAPQTLAYKYLVLCMARHSGAHVAIYFKVQVYEMTDLVRLDVRSAAAVV